MQLYRRYSYQVWNLDVLCARYGAMPATANGTLYDRENLALVAISPAAQLQRVAGITGLVEQNK